MRLSKETPAVGRFAPSPTGRMHAGNIFAALVMWLVVRSQGGRIVLRIEDLDRERSKQPYIDMMFSDFERLGLTWDDGPFYQSTRDEAYAEAFSKLEERGLVYPCFCTRADLHAASAPHRGEKLVYAGTCRNMSDEERAKRALERTPSARLVVDDTRYEINDLVQGKYSQVLSRDCGDFIIRRSDGLFAYQLAVVVDDAAQGVNCIVRGVDLLSSTPQQLYLQDLLGYAHPTYGHVPLLVAQRDRRLSKRDHDASVDELFARYRTAEGVIGRIAGTAGLAPTCDPISLEELLGQFRMDSLASCFSDKIQILWGER